QRSGYLCLFFQAEDGIRDATVTGVQTCALPICSSPGGKTNPLQASNTGRAPGRFSSTRADFIPRGRLRRKESRACRSPADGESGHLSLGQSATSLFSHVVPS